MPEYIRHDEGKFSSLTKQQKEAVGLLSIGTFLEYFDLMLYVHMAVLLNELFFPKADPYTQAIYSALAFCSTFVFRPLGALIFGYIGDNIGRKTTVVITTFMMGISCLIMAITPTYSEIGFTATVIITLCRAIQGLSSIGEIVGAEIYLSEITKPPIQYLLVSLVIVFATLGATSALGMASFITSLELNWRYAFWCGAFIAIVGTLARTTLRETPEFADAKRHISTVFTVTDTKKHTSLLLHNLNKENTKKTYLAYLLMQCTRPIWFYFSFIYCGNILKNSFEYTAAQVINQNFIVSMIDLLITILLTGLNYKIHPFKILTVKLILFLVFIPIFPFLMLNISTPFQLLLIQVFVNSVGVSDFPADAVLFKNFPVLKRFTCTSLTFAVSRALMYIITSFGLVYLVDFFNYWGLLIVIIPVMIGYIYGFLHFKKLNQVT